MEGVALERDEREFGTQRTGIVLVRFSVSVGNSEAGRTVGRRPTLIARQQQWAPRQASAWALSRQACIMSRQREVRWTVAVCREHWDEGKGTLHLKRRGALIIGPYLGSPQLVAKNRTRRD